ncbi:MAG: PIN domain-containing protein [Acidobacteria bacterium]|nr:PIN domain-containing protein [Acidobacteriota bacterium]
MTGLAFFDSNVLVYADDERSAEKQARAISLFSDYQRRDAAVISLQVLQEYFSATTTKLGVSVEIAQKKVELLAAARVVVFEPRDIVAAIELHRLNQISFWDALILHAARQAGAVVLFSEDLQHGAVLAGVRIMNPFVA